MTEDMSTLRIVREAQEITQTELAEQTGITQFLLSITESNKRELLPREAELLAPLLGVTQDLLLTDEPPSKTIAGEEHLSEDAGIAKTTRRRLEARLSMFGLHTGRLLKEIELDTDLSIPSLPTPEEGAAQAAQALREKWGLPAGPVQNLTRWMEAAGCIVIEDQFATNRVDAITQWVAGRPVILLNAQAPADRRRIALAHELGHLVMHAEHPPDCQEADVFAIEFLVPTPAILPDLHSLTVGKLRRLKRSWVVPFQALVNLASELEVISPVKQLHLTRQLRDRGMTLADPLSHKLPPERPHLTYEIGEALTGRGLSALEIANLMGFVSPDQNPFEPANDSSDRPAPVARVVTDLEAVRGHGA